MKYIIRFFLEEFRFFSHFIQFFSRLSTESNGVNTFYEAIVMRNADRHGQGGGRAVKNWQKCADVLYG